MNLKINDKDYPLHWGMGCIEMFCDTLSCEITDLDIAFNPGKEQIKYLTTLIHCAVKNGADVESVWDDFEVSYRQVQKAMDDLAPETYKAIIDDFLASKYFGKTVGEHLFAEIEKIPAEETEGVKKKSRSAKS